MRGAVRLATLLAFIALIPSTSTAPVDPVTALAPVEVWADGFGDLGGVAVDGEGAVYVTERLAGTVIRIAPDRSRTIVASSVFSTSWKPTIRPEPSVSYSRRQP